MSELIKLKGVVCPMVTPVDKDGNIDPDGVERLINHLYSGGIQYLLPSGTTGEGMLLSFEERKDLAERVVDVSKGKCKVIVHTGAASTRETVMLTQHAMDVGAYAASIITPFFYSYTDEELLHHYSRVAQMVGDFPLVLYSFPGNAKNKISTEIFKKIIAMHSQFIGIKLSDANLIQFQEYIEASHQDFGVLCGVDALMLPALSVGSKGQVSGNSNVFPELFCDLYDSFQKGDLEKAHDLQKKINKVREILKDNIAYFKAAMNIMGLNVGKTRSPIGWLDDQDFRQLAENLEMLLCILASGDC